MTPKQFLEVFGYGTEQITGSEIQAYILSGRQGAEGASVFFDDKRGSGDRPKERRDLQTDEAGRTGKTEEVKQEKIQFSAEKDPAQNSVKQAGETFTGYIRDTVETVKGLKKDIFTPVGSRPDTTFLNRMFSLLSHHAAKVPALKACFDAALAKVDTNRLLERLMLYTDGTPLFDAMKRLKKLDKAAYKRFGDYLLQRDMDKMGFRVKQEIVHVPTAMGPTPSARFVVSDERGRKLPEYFETENEAWAFAIETEVKNYAETARQAGQKVSDAELESLKNFRIIAGRMHDQLRQGIEEMIRKYELRGERMPEIVEYRNGKKMVVDIRRALAEMGDLRGHYFPRMRREGSIAVRAVKQGENPRLEFFDTKIMALVHKAKWKKKGYDVTLDVHARLSEDVYQEYGSLTNLQAMTSYALEKSANRDKNRASTLADIGLDSEIRDNKDGTEDLLIYGNLKMQHHDLMQSLGGKARGKTSYGHRSKSWAPGFRFENLKNDEAQQLLDTITNQVLAVDRLALDMDLALAEAFVQQLADTIRERGSRSRMISRGEETGIDVSVGYETDPIIAVVRAASGIAGGEAKRHMATQMVKAITGTTVSWDQYQATMLEEGRVPDYKKFQELVNETRIDPARQPSAYKEAMTLMKDMTRNDEKADRIIGTFKGLAVLKYLAFNVASPIVNLTNMVAGVPAAMNGFGNIPLRDTLRYVGKASKMYGLYKLRGGKGLSKEEISFFDDIEALGWTDAQMNQEAFAAIQGKMGATYNEALRLGMLPFSVSEQFNRAATLGAAYFGMKGHHAKSGEFLGKKQAWDHDTAMRVSKEITDKAHGIYGKTNRPSWARGDNPAAQLAQMAYVFKTFSHNYVLTMYELGVRTPGGKKAALWMAFAPIIFGVPASMGAKVVIEIVGKVMGSDDPLEDFYEVMAKKYGPMAERLARFGIPGVAPIGISFKNSLEIGVSDLPTDLNSLIGAPGNVVQDLWFGLNHMVKGDVVKGIERIAPRGLASPIKAWREHTEGLTTRTNAPVFFGAEPIKATTVEAMIRALSFTPSRITRMRDIQWSERKRKQNGTDERTTIHSKIKRFYLLDPKKRTMDKWAGILEDIRSYNDWAIKHHQPLVTPAAIKANLRRSFKPSTYEQRRQAQ